MSTPTLWVWWVSITNWGAPQVDLQVFKLKIKTWICIDKLPWVIHIHGSGTRMCAGTFHHNQYIIQYIICLTLIGYTYTLFCNHNQYFTVDSVTNSFSSLKHAYHAFHYSFSHMINMPSTYVYLTFTVCFTCVCLKANTFHLLI